MTNAKFKINEEVCILCLPAKPKGIILSILSDNFYQVEIHYSAHYYNAIFNYFEKDLISYQEYEKHKIIL